MNQILSQEMSKKMKHKKHNKLVDDYENQKHKNLEKLGSKMLKNQEKFDKLKNMKINSDFLKMFDDEN